MNIPFTFWRRFPNLSRKKPVNPMGLQRDFATITRQKMLCAFTPQRWNAPRIFRALSHCLGSLVSVVGACLGVIGGSVLSLGLVYAANTDDPLLTTVKPQIQAMFGSGSTVAYCIYIAEVVLGAIGYIKTKNLLLLLGVPILVVFTSAMFSYISGG